MLPLLIRAALAIALATLVISQHSLRAAEAFASVIGKVTVDGKPLAEGKILLHTDGVKPVEIPIKDGKYSADKVPTGLKTVTIEGKGVPAKYSSRETTSLTVEVKAGANELLFELKS
jgi:hypothetical protein